MQSLLWSNRNSLFCFFQISHSLLPATYLAFDSLEFVLCSFHLLSFSSFSTLLPIGPSLDFNIGFHPSLLPPECVHFLVLPRPYPSAKPPPARATHCHTIMPYRHHHFCVLCSPSGVPLTTACPTSVPSRPTSAITQSHYSQLFRTLSPLQLALFQQTTSPSPAKSSTPVRTDSASCPGPRKPYFQSQLLPSHLRGAPPVCYGLPPFHFPGRIFSSTMHLSFHFSSCDFNSSFIQ